MSAINNATRILNAKGIEYTAYVLPPEKIGALEAAELLSVASNLILKTIVALRPGSYKPVLGVIPGNRDLDLKTLAKVLNEKKIKLATQSQAEEITGLQSGGISPIALIGRGHTIIIDSLASKYPWIYISGGQRGLIIRLSPGDLAAVTDARLAPISR